jgi:hypothetical protein
MANKNIEGPRIQAEVYNQIKAEVGVPTEVVNPIQVAEEGKTIQTETNIMQILQKAQIRNRKLL